VLNLSSRRPDSVLIVEIMLLTTKNTEKSAFKPKNHPNFAKIRVYFDSCKGNKYAGYSQYLSLKTTKIVQMQ
jgi:hypothetical protein